MSEIAGIPKMKEVGNSTSVEIRNIKITGIPFDKRLEVLLSGILVTEVTQAVEMPGG